MAAGLLLLALLVVFIGFLLFENELPEEAGQLIEEIAAIAGIELELPTPAPAAQSDPGGALAVYFTDPSSRQAGEAVEVAMVAAIDSARRSVDVAVYNMSNQNLADALIRAHNRGVRVRMVMESEAMERGVPQALQDAGIPIIGDQREGLMHNKFIIIDGREVWMGSANFTNASLFSDSNNVVRIRSEQMAENYTVNFEEMFTGRLFGPAREANTPYPSLVVGSIPVEVYFSPDDGVAAQILEEIQAANASIHFLAYSYTRDDFAEAMLARAQRGVRVRGVFDESQYRSNVGGEFDNLLAAGLDVRLEGFSGLLHDKVIVVDQQVVITGSYNFSASAERNNDENIVIIRDPAIAAQYIQHFERAYAAAKE